MKRLREPRFGMVVSDGTGTWLLVAPEYPHVTSGNEALCWWALALRGTRVYSFPPEDTFLLFLDPDAFGEVEA